MSETILSKSQLVFASLDGDIQVAMTENIVPPRRAYLGDVVSDGANECRQWWLVSPQVLNSTQYKLLHVFKF